MKLKTLVIAVAVLAVLSAAVFWSGRPSTPPTAPDPRIGQPLADQGAIEKAATLRLSDQGRTILLTREPGGTWRDPGYFNLPADFSKLSGLINDLTAARIQRLVTTSPDRLARLEFKDSRIEFLDQAGKALWSVTLGKTADSGGRFVRFGDEPRAYLTDLNASLDTDAKNWADAQLISLKPDDIAKVEMPFDQGGPLTLVRAKKGGAWTTNKAPAGRKVSTDTVSAVLATLGALRFSDTTDLQDPQAAAARQHQRAFKFTSFDGTTTTVGIGRKPAMKGGSRKAEGGNGMQKTSEADEAAPAGPVYAFIASSDAKAPINGLMRKRAFQVDEYSFTSLPQKPADLFEPAQASPGIPAR